MNYRSVNGVLSLRKFRQPQQLFPFLQIKAAVFNAHY